MPKAEAGTAKAFANAQKAKGLTKLRFYCQVCSKPCRDENGYKSHISTEGHMRKLQAITGSKGERLGKVTADFSKQFQDTFVSMLSRRYGTRRIKANVVYNEYIQERHHLHMNATRWLSLSEFCKHLGREGIAKVEEDENHPGSWFLSWIDNSPAALARSDALKKMERAKLDEESRTRKFFEEQVRKAQEAEKGNEDADSEAREKAKQAGLQRVEESKPIRIGFSIKSNGSSSAQSTGQAAPQTTRSDTKAPAANSGFKMSVGSSSGMSSIKPALGFNALKAAAAKSTSAPGPSTSSASAVHAPPPKRSAVDQIMLEETERRKRKEMNGNLDPAKRMRL